MFDPNQPPPLVRPGDPDDGFFNAFPGHRGPQHSGMPPGSPWPRPHDPTPQWLQSSPTSAPPPWLNGQPSFPAHSYSHSWGHPSPFSRGQIDLAPNDAWNQGPAPLPWSSTIPTRPLESTFGQAVAPSYFGANKHAPNPSSPSHSPWNSLIRSISERASPHSAAPQWMPPSNQGWENARPKSAGPDRRARTPFQPARVGTPAHLMPDTWDETNLARRPRDWRADYNPRASFLSSISVLPSVLKGQSDVQEFTDTVKRRLCSLLEHHPTHPPMYHDLRLDPLHPSTLVLHASSSDYRNPFSELDMAQFATSPTANILRLYHPRLPWYIDVHATHPNGVTVLDVLSQVYAALMQQIMPRHYWNEVLSETDRREIGKAYQRRVAFLGDGREKGILWIDFLCDEVIFEGLTRTKGGLWEMRLKRPYAS